MTTLPDVRARGETQQGVVGRSITHHDFVEKVRGSLAYADDWSMPGMLYGKVVRAPVPSARILSIDVSEAASLPGVLAVLTAADVPSNEIREEASGLGVDPVSMPVLAADVVRYQGEPVALVAADRPEVAEEAAERVLVEYEDLPGVFDPRDALDPSAPLVHDRGNLAVDWRFERGDVDRALDGAHVVVEGEYRTQRVDHAYLETEGGVGWIDERGVLTLRVSTQVIEHARQIARILDIAESRVRVIGAYMGGGFGGKEDMTVEPHLALLVWRTRRPVKMIWSRQESLLARPKRHPFTMRYRTGVDLDGTLVANDIEILADAGAYPFLSPRVLFAGGVVAAGPYRVPAVRVRSRAAFTNNVPTSAFRGFGAMQVVFGYESQMDRIADALGISREAIRERNFASQGDALPTDEPLDTYVAVGETMRAALEAIGPRPEPGGERGRTGRGFACNIQPYGRSVFFADTASCWLGIERDGSVIVRIGVTDLGAGQAASLAQIAGEVLGQDPDLISVFIADTALTPLAGGTFATRQLYMSGNAVLQAASELRERLTPIARELLGASESEPLSFADGRVSAVGGQEPFLTLSELARAADARGVSPSLLSTFRAETADFDPRTGKGRTFPDYTYGTHVADVEVDVETGSVRLTGYAACHDVGRAIDPSRVEGQIQGGAVQGIGYALSEEIGIQDGIVASSLLADYLVPLSTDVPDVRAVVLEVGPGKGPFGARGIGEPPIAPAAAAIANAVADAIGVRLTELPMTPERVLDALRRAGPAAEAAGGS